MSGPVGPNISYEPETSLEKMWKYSELKLKRFPSVHQLAALLEKPLPVRLTQMKTEDLSEPDSPLISCHRLAASMDYFMVKCGDPLNAMASENSWQAYYDVLLGITVSLCRAKPFTVEDRRIVADPTKTTQQRLRPDFLLHSNGLVLLRGEEKSAQVNIEMSTRELTSKMLAWNVVLYRDLPYILGYATAGDRLRVMAIQRADGPCRVTTIFGFSILQEKALALEVFYNMAFLLHQMSRLTKRSYECGIQLFVPDTNSKRTIVLEEKVVTRTITAEQCSGIEDFRRIVRVYKALQELSTAGSPVTHLQTVEGFTEEQDEDLVVSLAPIGYLRLPTYDEVEEWLQHMLTALKFWHGRGYCHGDIHWRNILAVPTVCRSCYWMLIDMDDSRQPSEETVIQWSHPFQGHELQFQHDLFQLGELMDDFSSLPNGMKRVKSILLSAVDTALTAEELLGGLTTYTLHDGAEFAYIAFSGKGQTVGPTTYAADEAIQGAAVPAERPVIDDMKPTTTLQIRLHNGQRLRETLNLDHTIRDLHAIIQLNDAGAQPYALLAGFPPRPVSTDLEQTIEQAGLKGAAVTQKLI